MRLALQAPAWCVCNIEKNNKMLKITQRWFEVVRWRKPCKAEDERDASTSDARRRYKMLTAKLPRLSAERLQDDKRRKRPPQQALARLDQRSTKIQAVHRGRMARRQSQQMKDKELEGPLHHVPAPAEDSLRDRTRPLTILKHSIGLLAFV